MVGTAETALILIGQLRDLLVFVSLDEDVQHVHA
jgi:hypothetical protein